MFAFFFKEMNCHFVYTVYSYCLYYRHLTPTNTWGQINVWESVSSLNTVQITVFSLCPGKMFMLTDIIPFITEGLLSWKLNINNNISARTAAMKAGCPDRSTHSRPALTPVHTQTHLLSHKHLNARAHTHGFRTIPMF